MAAPKVFVSSTCFDLSEIREQLNRFIHSYGFEPILSENGDIFYKPDLHTHEACIREISNCQIFVLIIGGRFGGEYVADKTKSITNAEYSAARECNIPIFTYVRQGVLSNHQIYQQNRKKQFVADIDYPAIENQKYALDIFRFIDDVRRHPKNNALEGFQTFQNIEQHLRKQWAGMVYDLLKSKELTAQMHTTNTLIAGISASSQKLENLVKSLYLSSNSESAEKEIQSIETESDTELFFESVLRPTWIKEGEHLLDKSKVNISAVAEILPDGKTWDQYLQDTGLFEFDTFPVNPNEEDDEWHDSLRCMVTVGDTRFFLLSLDGAETSNNQRLFEKGVRKSNKDQREKALINIFEKYSV